MIKRQSNTLIHVKIVLTLSYMAIFCFELVVLFDSTLYYIKYSCFLKLNFNFIALGV